MRIVALVGCGVAASIVAIFAIAWGTIYNWPDYVHTNYGMPFIWGTRTTSTLAGPADKWSVDISMIVYDLSVWLGIVIIAVVGAAVFEKTRNARLLSKTRNTSTA